jgi:parvulin-like peptidyl-prolyl isomerase
MNVMNMGAYVKYIIFLTILILSACSGSPSESPNTQQPTQSTESLAPALPLTEHGEQIVATVNQQPITLIELERALDRYPSIPSAQYDAYLTQELDKLIQQALIHQLAQSYDIRVQASEVDAEYQTMRQIMPEEGVWEQWLRDNRFLNERDFWLTTLDLLTTARLREHVLNDLPDLAISQLKARHILVDSHDQAVIAYNRLQAGETFEIVASELSLDKNIDLGIDGGWFTAVDLIVPELADVASSQPIGSYSQPVETALGWHIVQTLEQSSRPALPEELALAQSQAFEDWLTQQINQAHIQRYIE